MDAVREAFVARFGEHSADAIWRAASGHDSLEKPTDFAGALAIAIGWECFTKPSYSKSHGIGADGREVAQWIRDTGAIRKAKEKDYIALMSGIYGWYLGEGDTAPWVSSPGGWS